jgi:hypothetical protein
MKAKVMRMPGYPTSTMWRAQRVCMCAPQLLHRMTLRASLTSDLHGGMSS